MREFLDEPQLIVVYLWTERKNIKFYRSLSQRWMFEDVMSSLADLDLCFALLQEESIRYYRLPRLWAEVQDAGLLFSGKKNPRLLHKQTGNF